MPVMNDIPLTHDIHHTDPVLLCVDDDPWVLDVTRRVLEQEGYSVLTAPGGKEAIELFCSNRVDLVLVDYEMPDMKGHEVAVRIKTLNPRMPVVMQSGAPVVPDAAIKVTDAFVSKGADIDLLVAAIANVLTHYRANGGLMGPNAAKPY